MDKIYITVIVIAIIIIAGLVADDMRLRKNLITTELALESQNKQIEEARIEVEEYKNRQPKVLEKIVEVYRDRVEVVTNEEAEKNLEACVKKFKNYNKLLELYNQQAMKLNGIDTSTLNKDNNDEREAK